MHQRKVAMETFNDFNIRPYEFFITKNANRYISGDIILLKEWDLEDNVYTGREKYVVVTEIITKSSELNIVKFKLTDIGFVVKEWMRIDFY